MKPLRLVLLILKKYHQFSKVESIRLLNRLIYDFEELTFERDKLFKVFADEKIEYIELKDVQTITNK